MLMAGYLFLSSYCAVLVSYLASNSVRMPFTDMTGLINSSYTFLQRKGAELSIMEQATGSSKNNLKNHEIC